ncbi:MAG: bifunctional riboflavin kinase/FAD synthetase [Desulfuromonadia bacterium]
MTIIRSINDIPSGLPAPVVTLGNFDGVHRGHREIFRRVTDEARSIGGVSVVVTFRPHPLKVIPNLRNVVLITTYEERARLIERCGIDLLIEIPFDQEVAQLSPRRFIHDILLGKIGVKSLFIGYDYAFGHNREGRVPLLVAAGKEHGFTVRVLEPINNGSEIFSSSAIRRLVQIGEVSPVVELLGRHFSLCGRVVRGHGRGASLGFPTANILTDKELIPPDGVYAVKVSLDGVIRDAACNIGRNPTYGNRESSIEVHIFDLDQDLYDKTLEIFFIERIRGERKFTGPETLREAIGYDVRRCREILSSTPLITFDERGTTC